MNLHALLNPVRFDEDESLPPARRRRHTPETPRRALVEARLGWRMVVVRLAAAGLLIVLGGGVPAPEDPPSGSRRAQFAVNVTLSMQTVALVRPAPYRDAHVVIGAVHRLERVRERLHLLCQRLVDLVVGGEGIDRAGDLDVHPGATRRRGRRVRDAIHSGASA